ncbi:MAG: Smr/MutS family protein [Pseudomonadota bacterium]
MPRVGMALEQDDDALADQRAADELAAFHASIVGVTPLPETQRQRLFLAASKPPPPPRRLKPSVDASAFADWPWPDTGEFSQLLRLGSAWTNHGDSAALDSNSNSDADSFSAQPTGFLNQGVQRKVLRDLRRGRWPVERHLDLHGLNRHQAQAQLMRCLASAQRAGVRCLRIVHGRGYGSPGQKSILRQQVKASLANLPAVLAFCTAPAHDGGEGAVWVLLRTFRTD